MNMKTLKEHNTVIIPTFDNSPSKNGIACDVCEEELYDSSPGYVLTSWPPQKNVHCEKCGFRGYRRA